MRPVCLALATLALACGPDAPAPAPRAADADELGRTPPSAATAAAQRALAETLPLADGADFEAARRGLVASEPEVVIERDDGTGVLWDSRSYAFLEGEAPESVNPSLWRQAKLNAIHGLFEVVPGVWQVRGYDLANLTVIRGETGWILVDPLTAKETARAALALVQKTLGERPISAVIYTHSHVDHFGGVLGVLSDDPAAREGVRIVAPEGFLHEATSENLLAGVAMSRRAQLMYGMPLARDARGHVGSGLGKEPGRGSVGVLPPTEIVDRTPQPITIDGVEFVFQNAAGSEAPAELMFYLPAQQAFCGAEVVSRTMHNLYTLRGAKVRDALRWSGYVDEAIQLFPEMQVVFNSHHWPVWGNEDALAYLARQRDTYKYIHDQTLRLANAGLTSREIAEQLELPESLRPHFANRGYYGTVRHNAKAVYQFYFGWYDGNPANLDPLPPEDAGARYVDAMGGAAAVRERAAGAIEAGELRWAATLLDHLIFSDPDDGEARALLARAYDQLGYRAESGPWRDVYLTAARELRDGIAEGQPALAGAIDLLRQIPVARFFDAMATRLDPAKAEGDTTRLVFDFPDLGETHELFLENAVLHHRPVTGGAPEADATLRMTHDFFLRLMLRQAGLRDLVFSDELEIDGSRTALLSFLRMLEPPNERFAIVTP